MDLKRTQLLLLFFAFLCAPVRKLNGDSIPGCIPNERNALLAFKEGLKDPSNRLSSWVGDDCCTWKGVACDNQTGHVVKLDLRNPHQLSYFNHPPKKWCLGGELRPALLGLKHLNYLDLSMNDFGGISIPEFMGSFRQLKYLNLSWAYMGGLIPHQLGNLSSLQNLDLSHYYYYYGNNFEVPPEFLIIDNAIWISRLSSLRYLNMTEVQFREGAHWLQALNMLPSIVEVRLQGCGINTIPLSLPHVNFTSLSVLDLSWNSINSTIPGWLFNISSLEYFDLSYNFFRGIILPAIKNLASLKALHLSGNQFLEGKILILLEGLCKLQSLRLSGINISKNLHEFDEMFSGCIKNSLETLELEDTQLSGYLPDWLGDFRKLKYLDLSGNSISGPIPESLGRLSALQELYLFDNKLNETFPKSLGRLAELIELSLEGNFLKGVMSEEQFANFTKLKILDLSQNQLILNLTSDWIPPFQLQGLVISSCKLGPRFPAWLRMLKNITYLDISSTGISDTIPDWFWRSFSQIWYLDISSNGITGRVPDLTDFINLHNFNLSSNHFEGPLPNFNSLILSLLDLSNNSFSRAVHLDIGKSMPNLKYLSLSINNLSGEISLSLCHLRYGALDLSKNLLSGELPDCWNHSSLIIVMDFSNNSLSGSIPPSICSLPFLESLHLSNNNLSGELPSSLKSCARLNTLDLGQNGFIGTIPTWIGESLLSLKILCLRSNKLVGNIPHNLSRLKALQILDLASNNLSGTIPSSFGNFTAMKVSGEMNGTILKNNTYYNENMQVTIKGIYIEYAILLPLVIVMDLSNNNLSGMIPEELTSLFGLVILNLSENHLTGDITEKISILQQLESLDLSRNNFFGGIPSSIIGLTFLTYLNLSYNNLSGRVPTGNQLQTFIDPSIYIGNPNLCGFPLSQKCKDDKTNQGLNAVGGDEQNDNTMDKEGSEMKWLYMSMGPGFAVGFWIVFGPLLFNREWREAYFQHIDQVFNMVYMVLAIISPTLQCDSL
uniref:Receptor-like protein EIX2 n=1 Tax=Elaeis guineensis var. tenera TaxID=51953 RepID=A0A8N4EUL9_ELAGV|nr:receptor-like protein EIX2 [Elaeis guineensis]